MSIHPDGFPLMDAAGCPGRAGQCLSGSRSWLLVQRCQGVCCLGVTFFYQLRFWFLETGLIESYLTVGGSSTFVSLS